MFAQRKLFGFFVIPAFALLALLLCESATGHHGQVTPDPGYRADNYFDPAFAESMGTATIAVLPTVIRRAERCAVSFDSQQQIVDFLADRVADAVAKPRRIDLGPVRRESQWQMFEYGARSVTETIEGYDTGTDYTMVMEILVPDYSAVFGIEIYIVDRDGRHALSFLLNEHHKMFADAKLHARNSSEEARKSMIRKATKVGLAALDEQLKLLREGQATVGTT